MSYRFRKPTLDDAQQLLEWRTTPEISRYSFTDVVYDLDRQRAWLERSAARQDLRHFVVCNDETPVGYLAFTDIDWANRRCTSGSYIGVPSERKRIGALWTWYLHDYCFYRMGMHKLVNYFMAGNERVIRGQTLNGFRQVGTFRDHICKNGVWVDVHAFELLREEWDAFPRRIFPVEKTLAAFED
jgi:UDP-4-amino-4,6-dideoxy-N-acetyl-beta-L-altrosamine N-acetyltransferase